MFNSSSYFLGPSLAERLKSAATILKKNMRTSLRSIWEKILSFVGQNSFRFLAISAWNIKMNLLKKFIEAIEIKLDPVKPRVGILSGISRTIEWKKSLRILKGVFVLKTLVAFPTEHKSKKHFWWTWWNIKMDLWEIF